MACDATSDVITGKDAKAVFEDELVLRMTRAVVNPSSTETAWGDSSGGDYTLRETGRRECTGTVEGKFSTDRAIHDMVSEGDKIKIAIWPTPTTYWVFPCALIQNYSLTFDNDTKEVVGWTLAFGNIGIFYRPGQSGAPVQTLPSS